MPPHAAVKGTAGLSEVEVVQQIPEDLGVGSREVGVRAVWTLSTAKPGNGVAQLRDGKTETYWQSDGPQPHLINIQFNRKQTVSVVYIYLDFSQDESYTPSRITLRAGSHFNDLKQIMAFKLEEPQGWVRMKVNEDGSHHRANLLQIAITQNHQSGRDAHVRQVRVFGPAEARNLHHDPLTTFTSPEFQALSTIR